MAPSILGKARCFLSIGVTGNALHCCFTGLLVLISLVLFIAHFRPGIEEWLVLLEQGFEQIAIIDLHCVKRFDCPYIER